MKEVRFLLILIVVSFLTGCKVDYNLDINNDLSVSETVTASESQNKVEVKTGLKGDEAINYLFNIFKRGKSDEVFYFENKDNIITAIVSNNYNSLDEYRTYAFSNLFDDVAISEKDNKVTISSNQINKLGNNGSRTLLYDEVNINITVPYKVISNNADSVKKNTYTWNIKKDEDLRKIKISFNKEQKKNSLLIGTKNNKLNVNYNYIVIGIIVVVICITIIVVTINNKKNNTI